MLSFLLVTVYVIVCLLLLTVVLLQQGRGGDIASAFGGGGSQTAFGAQPADTFAHWARSRLEASGGRICRSTAAKCFSASSRETRKVFISMK